MCVCKRVCVCVCVRVCACVRVGERVLLCLCLKSKSFCLLMDCRKGERLCASVWVHVHVCELIYACVHVRVCVWGGCVQVCVRVCVLANIAYISASIFGPCKLKAKSIIHDQWTFHRPSANREKGILEKVINLSLQRTQNKTEWFFIFSFNIRRFYLKGFTFLHFEGTKSSFTIKKY